PIKPDPSEPPQREAGLSVLVGEERRTYGLLGGFDPEELGKLADDLHRRLTAFRHEQGLVEPLDPVSVVETTSGEVEDAMNTLPPTGALRRFAGAGFLLLRNRWTGTVWCLAMLAGLVASGSLFR